MVAAMPHNRFPSSPAAWQPAPSSTVALGHSAVERERFPRTALSVAARLVFAAVGVFPRPTGVKARQGWEAGTGSPSGDRASRREAATPGPEGRNRLIRAGADIVRVRDVRMIIAARRWRHAAAERFAVDLAATYPEWRVIVTPGPYRLSRWLVLAEDPS